MKKNLIAYMIFVFAFDSCNQKFYSKNDYSFYKENFELKEEALLQTNGVYVLESIWSSADDYSTLVDREKSFFVFYKTGQSNRIMVPNASGTLDYEQLIIEDHERRNNNKNIGTLFQGYYKLSDNKIIIENANAALRRFNYSYGYFEDDKLIIVKPNALQGEGKFDDKYFLETYKETYVFVPVENLDSILPYW